MALTTETTKLRWPDPHSLNPSEADPSYNSQIDLLELRFTHDTIARAEVPLDAQGRLAPWASVRLDANDNLTGDVVGVMVDNFSYGFAAHPEWRELADGRPTRHNLASLIAVLSRLPPEPD